MALRKMAGHVIYNYDEKAWYVGTLSRTSWVDRGVYQYPMATSSNLVYNHEKENDNDGTGFYIIYRIKSDVQVEISLYF